MYMCSECTKNLDNIFEFSLKNQMERNECKSGKSVSLAVDLLFEMIFNGIPGGYFGGVERRSIGSNSCP